jgi:tetratricopeptide (TPR) repeat protein
VALLNEGRVAEALAVYKESADAYVRNGRAGTRMALMAEQDVSAALYRMGEIRESYEIAQRVSQKLTQLTSDEDTGGSFTVNIAGIANRLAVNDPNYEKLPAIIARAEKESDLQFLRLGSVELARLRMRLGAPRAEVAGPLDHLEAVHAAAKKEITPATRVLLETIRADLDMREGLAQSADQRVRGLLQFLADKQFKAPRPNFLAHCAAARTALAMRDAARAAAEARIAVQLAEPMARGPDTSADVGEALLLLGRALIDQSRVNEARIVLERAVQCLKSGYGVDHPQTREAVRLVDQPAV